MLEWFARLFSGPRRGGWGKGFGLGNATAAVFATELQGFEKLDPVKKLRIELENWEGVDQAVQRYAVRNKTDFDPIPFWIVEASDKNKENRPKVYKAEVISEANGFVVRDIESNEELMHVVLPEKIRKKDRNMGTIKHPGGAALYRVGKAAGGKKVKEVLVQKATGDNIGSTCFRIVPIPNPIHLFVQCMGGCVDTNDYSIKHGNDSLGKIKPRFSLVGTNAYTLKYYEKCTDQQKRAAMLGYALLLVLMNGYPELVNLMQKPHGKGYGSTD